MRCLILISLCVVFASATYLDKIRFKRLLDKYSYQKRYTFDEKYDLDDFDDKFDEDTFDDFKKEKWLKYEKAKYYQGLSDEDYLEKKLEKLLDEDSWTKSEKDGSELLKEVEDANVKLASRLYTQSKDEKDDKNTVVSPLSVQVALAALNRGAGGNSKRQIGRTIAGSLQKEERRQVFKGLYRLLKDQSKYLGTTKINPVTVIALSKKTPAQQLFVQFVKGDLGASVKLLDFQRRPQESRKLINDLVSRKTNAKINNIVPKDAITDNTKLILVNALETKATWGRQMLQHVNKEAKFFPLDSKQAKIVEVMETEGRFKYHEDELVKVVGIPTKEKELTFYTIVPKEKDGLTTVDKVRLQDNVQLKQLLDKTDRHVDYVAVQLPKFEIKHKLDVRRTLKKQGVTDIFDPQRADFSGLTGLSKDFDLEDKYEKDWNKFDDEDFEYELLKDVQGDKLHLNKFIHQATIKVTDKGITTATDHSSVFDDIDLYDRSLRDDRFDKFDIFDDYKGWKSDDTLGQKVVKANRAFAFVIKHNPTKQVLLIGRVIDAAQKKTQGDYYTIKDQFDLL